MAEVLARRITGVETEYGITCTEGGIPVQTADEVARLMFQPIVQAYGSSNVFIPNGSRLYLDVGSHPEYASVECDSLSQLIAYDKAGDRLVHQLAAQAEQHLDAGQIYLFKNNVDSAGNSYGCHENYLVHRSVVLKSFGQQLLPFLLTRQLIAGAGCIHDGEFLLSQRADHVWEGVSSATTRSRPIINTRDEPHADSHQYRRLHVIVGDSNMAQPTMALKIGSMQLVLEMLEAGIALPAMDNDISVIRDIARDRSGATTVCLQDGSQRSALSLQREYAAAAHRWLAQREDIGTPTAELARVVELWENCLEWIATGNIAQLARYVDWAAKLQLFQQFQARLDLGSSDFSHPKLAQIDLAYHDIHPTRGLFYALQRRGAIATWVEEADIAAAMHNPPATTRGKLRGAMVALGQELQAPVVCDWVRIKVARPEPQIVELQDPFATDEQRIAPIADYVRENAPFYAAGQSQGATS
ncbi:MAG: Pup--protein ligase [Corynebacterium sp.]|nr:Pup--protein ligase [Corynebacterium sp.]